MNGSSRPWTYHLLLLLFHFYFHFVIKMFCFVLKMIIIKQELKFNVTLTNLCRFDEWQLSTTIVVSPRLTPPYRRFLLNTQCVSKTINSQFTWLWILSPSCKKKIIKAVIFSKHSESLYRLGQLSQKRTSVGKFAEKLENILFEIKIMRSYFV